MGVALAAGVALEAAGCSSSPPRSTTKSTTATTATTAAIRSTPPSFDDAGGERSLVGRRLAHRPRARTGRAAGRARASRGISGSGDLATSASRWTTSLAQARAGADSASRPRVASASALGLLAEHVVRERRRDLARQPVAGDERRQAGMCAGAHRVDGDAQQRGDLVVGAPLLQDERDDGALVGGERLEGAHATDH